MHDDERLHELREAADQTAQRLEAAQAAGQRRQSGSDATATVHAVRADGGAWTITVDLAWRQSVARESLGSAVLEALNDASTSGFAAWAEAFAGSTDEPAPRPRPAPTYGASPAAHISESLRDTEGPEATLAALREFRTMLTEFNDHLDDTVSVIAQRANTAHRASSPTGKVSAQATAQGRVTSIDVDQRWLADASATAISDEVTAAVVRAIAEAEATMPDNPLAGTKVERYGNALDNPAELARIFTGRS